jgi:hypothetical protein
MARHDGSCAIDSGVNRLRHVVTVDEDRRIHGLFVTSRRHGRHRARVIEIDAVATPAVSLRGIAPVSMWR